MKPSQFCLWKKFIIERAKCIEIKSLLKEKDVLAMLPTGFGKSLLFQGITMVRLLLSVKSTSWHGHLLVVSPPKEYLLWSKWRGQTLGLTALETENPKSRNVWKPSSITEHFVLQDFVHFPLWFMGWALSWHETCSLLAHTSVYLSLQLIIRKT